MWSTGRRIRAEPVGDDTASPDPPIQPPRTNLTFAESARFLLSARHKFTGQRHKYDEFVEIIAQFNRGREESIRQVMVLFDGDADLICGLSSFLPAAYRIDIQDGAAA